VGKVSLALLVDRIYVRLSIGYSAFELVYGSNCLVPVAFMLESWTVVDWEGEVRTKEDGKEVQKVLTEIQAAENIRNT
jgi:hypothetical protein